MCLIFGHLNIGDEKGKDYLLSMAIYLAISPVYLVQEKSSIDISPVEGYTASNTNQIKEFSHEAQFCYRWFLRTED